MSLALSRPLGPTRRALRHHLRRPLSRRLSVSLLTLAVLLLLWWLVARLGLINPLFLPPPARCCINLSPLQGRKASWMPPSGSTSPPVCSAS
ncbi:hypothetical protein [Aeromonas sp. MdU4]|uniref:hypothetical protein n=1 Tax=Aeromonas sp. MdU4 TaxID=3342819 RepID=UPI0035BB4A2E